MAEIKFDEMIKDQAQKNRLIAITVPQRRSVTLNRSTQTLNADLNVRW